MTDIKPEGKKSTSKDEFNNQKINYYLKYETRRKSNLKKINKEMRT